MLDTQQPLLNRLAEEISPYLLQHKDNPVAWQPWGPEAFATAKRLNKPVLLSAGYTACHWCHVMAHESFENAEIAAHMNELFVNIKLDREERPDLDTIYQQALALLGQPGGVVISSAASHGHVVPNASSRSIRSSTLTVLPVSTWR